MSCGCGCAGQALRHATLLAGRDLACTPGQQLIGVVDRLRDLRSQFGLRPYLVTIVREQWSGGRRGVGVATVTGVLNILPVPKVMDLTSLSEVSSPGGITEEGNLLVTEISGAYSEDVLMGNDAEGRPPDPDANVFWEIAFTRPDGGQSAPRRFAPASAPHYDAEGFGWQVRLERARPDRRRDGSPQ